MYLIEQRLTHRNESKKNPYGFVVPQNKTNQRLQWKKELYKLIEQIGPKEPSEPQRFQLAQFTTNILNDIKEQKRLLFIRDLLEATKEYRGTKRVLEETIKSII